MRNSRMCDLFYSDLSPNLRHRNRFFARPPCIDRAASFFVLPLVEWRECAHLHLEAQVILSAHSGEAFVRAFQTNAQAFIS